MKKPLLVAAALLISAAALLGAQEVSEKKEIAIFRLSYYDWNIPGGALGSIDEEMKSVFINLGRFDVIGLSFRPAETDANEFIGKIREYKQRTRHRKGRGPNPHQPSRS